MSRSPAAYKNATSPSNAPPPRKVGRAPGSFKSGGGLDHVDSVLHTDTTGDAASSRKGERFAGDKSHLGTRDYIGIKVVSKPNHFGGLPRKKAADPPAAAPVYTDPMNPKNFAGARSTQSNVRGRRAFTHADNDIIASEPPAAPQGDAKGGDAARHVGKRVSVTRNFETGAAELPPRGAAPAHRAKKTESTGMAAVMGCETGDKASSSNQQSHPSNTAFGGRRVRRQHTAAGSDAAGARPAATGKSVAGKQSMERHHGSLSQAREGAPKFSRDEDVAGLSSTMTNNNSANNPERRYKREVSSVNNKAAEAAKKSATSSLTGILRPENTFKKRDFAYAPPWGMTDGSAAPPKPAAAPKADVRPSWQQTPRDTQKRSSGTERKHTNHVSATQALHTPWATS